MLRIALVALLASAAAGRRTTDDGKGILLSALLTQPFRVSLLKDERSLKQGIVGQQTAVVGSSSSSETASAADVVSSSFGLNDFGFALAFDGNSHVANSMYAIHTKVYTSPLFFNPRATASASSFDGMSSLFLNATIDRYDNKALLKAQKLPREEMKAATTARKTRYANIHDSRLTVTINSAPAADSPSSIPLLTLATLNPFAPNTAAVLGGRVGAVTQATRFESTGHTVLEGLMTAEASFYDSLLASSSSNKRGGSNKKKGEVVHGTFTLTFVNRHEFTLALKPLPSADGSSAAAAPVAFYGSATVPLSPAAATASSILSSYFGLTPSLEVGASSTSSTLSEDAAIARFVYDTIFGLGTYATAAAAAAASTADGVVSAALLRNPLVFIGGTTASALEVIPSTVDKFFAAVVRGLTGPFTFMLSSGSAASIATDKDEDEVRALIESIASFGGWAFGSWPLLLAIGGVLVAKLFADFMGARKEAQEAREEAEKERLRKESDARLRKLLGQE